MATELKSTTPDVSLTRFYGGEQRGTCVQVTTTYTTNPSDFFKHVSFTRQEARSLAQDLLAFANGDEEPDYEGECDCYGCVTMRKPCIKEIA